MLKRVPIQIPPGVFRQGSEAEMAGKWYETQLIRWVQGVLRPIAGWDKLPFTDGIGLPLEVSSTIRATYIWTDKSGITRTALLCEGHLYVLESNTLIDITPVDGIQAPYDDPVAGGYGDFIYYGAGGGIDEPDPPGTPLPPLYTDPTGYGTARGTRIARKFIEPSYTLDNWGEDLLAMTSTDGRLLRWKPSDPPGTRAAVVPNAPVGNRTFVVTPERHVMLFQMGGEFNAWGWCDQEDIENWDFTDITSMAGRYNVEPAGPILCACSTRAGVIFFTPNGAYLARYLGLPYVYSSEPLGRYAAPMTSASLVRMVDNVIWPTPDGFWMFDGSTITGVQCPILDWIYNVIDPVYATIRMSGVYIGMQTEIWWFIPSRDKTENDRYVVFDFQDSWWGMGKLSRTCGATGTSVHYPMMSDGTSIFEHEKGTYYFDAPELPFAQSGALNIANGAQKSTFTRGIADTRAPAGDVQFWLESRTGRIDESMPPPLRRGPFPVRPDGKVDFRVTGRDLAIRIESTRNGTAPWTFGQMLIRQAPRGQR